MFIDMNIVESDQALHVRVENQNEFPQSAPVILNDTFSAIHGPGGYPHGRSTIGNVPDYDSVRAYAGVTADGDVAYYFCSGANKYMVTQLRTLPPLGANRDLMFYINMFAAANLAVNHDSGGMHKDKPPAKFRPTADNAVTKQGVPLVKNHFQR